MPPLDHVLTDIKNLTTQGATNVALATLDFLEHTLTVDPTIPNHELRAIGEKLAYARPTEPLAQNAIRYIFANSKETPLSQIQSYKQMIMDGKVSIPQLGLSTLVDGGSYLTLCHSSTTISLLREARAIGTYFRMYVAETRPLFQGRKTAIELLHLGFDDVTIIIDDVAVSLIEGRKGAIDAIFIGADLLAENGFINKVGSLAIVSAAEKKHIPVYCVTTLLKYNPQPFTNDLIETRSSNEIWPNAPKNLQFYAPAFDYVPYFSNVYFICEAGILPYDQLKRAVEKFYPFVL